MTVQNHEEADSQAAKVFVHYKVVLVFPPRIVGLQTLSLSDQMCERVSKAPSI